MRRTVKGVLLLCVCCWVAACAEKPVDMASVKGVNVEKNRQFHGGAQVIPAKMPKMKTTESLKKRSLHGFPQKTVGEAFDSYPPVVAKEWKEGKGNDQKYYVDYIGWFAKNAVPPAVQKEGVVQWGIDVKFAIDEDGNTYITMITKLLAMQDGTIKPSFFGVPDAQIVETIYSGKELTF